jgi:hypothetical protein
MPNYSELRYGQEGHTTVKRDYGRYTLYKVHEGENRYRKVMHSENYEDIRPHRHEHAKKWTYKPPPPYSLTAHRDWQRKHFGSKVTGDRYGGKPKKVKVVKEVKIKPLPIPKTPAPKKVVQTMDATLKAKDKALERIAKPDKLVIKEKERPQKVRVPYCPKTSIMVYPHQVEGAVQRYNQRYHQSQQQPCHTARQSPNKGKKQSKNDTIYAY